jgi:hypothetical protein
MDVARTERPDVPQNYLWRAHPFDWLARCLLSMATAGLTVGFLLAPYHPDSGSGEGLVHPYITILISGLGAICAVPIGLGMIFCANTRTFGGLLWAVGVGLGLGLWFALPS